jgi:hypothetical protein
VSQEFVSEQRVRTRHAALTLREIADALPGTGEVMASVGRCFGSCWHAAQGGNWELAEYMLRRVRSLLRGLSVTRPKYRKQIQAFDSERLEPVAQALIGRDLAGFESTAQAAVHEVNRLHVETGYAYIRWRFPDHPPDESLDLSSG